MDDATKIVARFNDIMERNKARKQHLSVTLTELSALKEDVENLFHPDDLKQ